MFITTCYDRSVVEFATYKDMRKAIDKLDGTDINGRKIKLVEDSRNRKNRWNILQINNFYKRFNFMSVVN